MKSLYKFFVANYFGHRVNNYLSVCSKFIYCCLISREQLFSFIRDDNKFPNEQNKSSRRKRLHWDNTDIGNLD